MFLQCCSGIIVMSQQEYTRKRTSVVTATALASLISTFITNPIEVAKLNFQYLPLQCRYYPHQSYAKLMACDCSRISFQGSAQSLKLAMPQVLFSNLMYMPLYESLRQFLVNQLRIDSIWSTMMASTFSRTVVTTANFPFQSLRVRLSNEVKNYQLNFHGYKVTLVRDLIYSAIFWPMLQYYRNHSIKGEYRAKIQKSEDFTWNNFTTNLIPGFLIGSCASALTTPLDTLKTRIQSKGIKSYAIANGIMQIYNSEGISGLFSGVHWRMLKNSLHGALYVFLYEWYVKKVSSGDICCAHFQQS